MALGLGCMKDEVLGRQSQKSLLSVAPGLPFFESRLRLARQTGAVYHTKLLEEREILDSQLVISISHAQEQHISLLHGAAVAIVR